MVTVTVKGMLNSIELYYEYSTAQLMKDNQQGVQSKSQDHIMWSKPPRKVKNKL